MYIRCFCFLCGQAAVHTAWVPLQLHVCVSMSIDALCECCLSAALHMKRAISLPLPDLGPPTTHRQQCPLPCLLDPEGHRTTKWVAGLTCPSIYRGGVGSGDVSLQAYHLIHNLHVNLAKSPIDACCGWGRLASGLTVAGLSLLEWGGLSA